MGQDIKRRIREISEQQVLILSSHNKMLPGEIIRQYTGVECSGATLSDAIESVEKFNTDAVKKYGLLPC